MLLTTNISYLDEYVTKYINDILRKTNENEFDENEFVNWLNENFIQNKNNPSAYVKKVFMDELNRGTFRKQEIKEQEPNVLPLINALRTKGVVVSTSDTVFINILFSYLINIKNVSQDSCISINKKILDYMKTDRFSEYEMLIRQAKTLKLYKIDWNYIDQKVVETLNEWKELLNGIEESEDSYD